MKGKDGKMECMDKTADAKPAAARAQITKAVTLTDPGRRRSEGWHLLRNEAALDPVPWYGVHKAPIIRKET